MSRQPLPERLRSLADRLATFPSPRAQRVLLVLVVPALAAGAVVAYRNLDLDVARVGWGYLAVGALVGGPVSSAVTAWEYRTQAAVLGHRVGWLDALRVTVVASALNYLPGHGGALWRVQHLRRMGSGYGRATTVTLMLAFVWLGLAAVTAGALLVAHGGAVGGVFAALGVTGLALATVLLRHHHPRLRAAAGWAVRVVAVEAASIGVSVARLSLVLLALGHGATLTAAVVLALAGIIASASGVLRGGLGLRELLAGTFAPLVGLPIALGFLAAAVDRLTGTVGRLPLVVLLYALRGDEAGVDERADVRTGVE